MAVLTADFETGVNGNTVASTDTGSATAWSSVTIPATCGIVYSNTHAYGLLSGQFSTGGTAGNVFVTWSSGVVGTITDHYGRIYLYVTANPSAAIAFVRLSSGATLAARMAINSAGRFILVDSASVVQATSTNIIAKNQWVRIEYHMIHSATVGQLELKYFSNSDSSTADETVTTAANLNTLASANTFQWGMTAGTTSTNYTFWGDNISANNVAYPGAVAVSGSSRQMMMGVG